MVLIVVLSVFGGFEKLVKNRVLSYTPHITIERMAPWPDTEQFPEEYADYNAQDEWRAIETSMQQLEGVESAYALINDYVIIDRHGAVAPASMQAIDTESSLQLQSLQKLIKKGMGNADMGMGDNAVISSLTAEKFGIRVGDIIQIHTNRNLQQIQPVLERIGSDALAVSQEERLSNIQADMRRITRKQGGQDVVGIEDLQHLYHNQIRPLNDHNLREAETEIVNSVLIQLENFLSRTTAAPDNSGDYLFPEGHIGQAIALLDSLAQIDIQQQDINNIKEMKTVVLPKDLTIIGIYQATRHAMSPDVFVPLPVGQDLTGLGDGVHGIALRLDDPYLAQQVLQETVLPHLPDNGLWRPKTWMQQHQQQFGLIKTQRQLLTFSLSFIMLVSAFSIMAVMFTVTIQKKREIGVMKALGAAPAQLVRVFLYQGIIIGFLGGISGLGLGYLVIIKRQALLDLFASWGFDPFPSDFNGFDGLPADLRPEEFVAVFIFAFVMCIIATLVPAIAASRSDAAKSLRNM